MDRPELLSPAGTLRNMRYAFAYGADAVYAGQPRYSLRVRNNEFDYETLRIGIQEAHAQHRRLYVVCNIQPHNPKLKTFVADMRPVVAMQPDALIMSDPGLIMMAREHFPDMPIHLSVQANAVNWATVRFWQNIGIERVILSRELSLEEIDDIARQVPDVELEVFVHGALCMAYSGRCLLSGYMNRRDSNQGTCTNACRWQYKAYQAGECENGSGDVVVQSATQALTGAASQTNTSEAVALLEEQSRPGELMPTFEDEHGTYIMNARDLRAIRHVERLAQIGVHSLKIEGRTKSFYYCARTAQLYRQAIDDAVAGRPFNQRLEYDLEGLAHRGYTEGFLRRHIRHSELQNYQVGHSVSEYQQFVGACTGRKRGDLVEIEVKNKFLAGDSAQIMTPEGNLMFIIEHIEDHSGQMIDAGKGSGHSVYIPVPENILLSPNLDKALLLRNLGDNQTTRRPHHYGTTD